MSHLLFHSYEKKIPDRSNVKKEGLISVHSLRVHPIMVVKSWWQKESYCFLLQDQEVDRDEC